jgi:serine phosphatase RsbU (regulator of sigma subunit)
MPEILIYTPDGKKRTVPLESERMTLGRSSTADLSFTEDNGLSRLHLAFERSGSGMLVRDLNSKNGTVVNGNKVTDAHMLKPNDKVACGHLLIVYEPPHKTASSAVFIDEDTAQTDGATIVTSLGGVMSESGKAAGAGQQITALIRAGNELASERPLPELFRIILDLAIGAVSAGRGVLFTMENGEMVERASKGENFKISSAVRDRVMDSKLSVLVRDTTLDDALRERQSIIAQNVRTLMAVPLQVRDQVLGLIYVDSPSLRKEFTRDDLGLLTVMANVAAIRVEHARLAEVEQARKLMEHELKQAETIQRSALPAQAPAVPGLDIAGYNAASRTVGGDYYDFFTDAEGHAALMLADVSGKGMPAALMVMGLQARVQPLFESLPVESGALKSAMERLNRLTTANCPPGRFITVFACVADGRSGQINWVSAGHNPSLIVRKDGTFEVLRGGGPIMGFFPELIYPEFEARLQPGDLLTIYSDGITEACSPEGKDFDIPRLAATLVANRHREAKDIVELIAEAVRQWTHNAPPADDITVVVARMVG